MVLTSKAVALAVAAAGAPPAKTNVLIRGQSIPLAQTQEGLRLGLGIAIIAVFLLLAGYYQSIRLPLIILITVPAVLAGAGSALYVMGETLNVQSYIGTIMAIGVAMANSILLVTFAHRHLQDGASKAVAALSARSERLRPILMTSLAMIAGMIPMAMGMGEAGAQTAPLGRAVIGGLIAATIATLLVVPAAFALFAGKPRAEVEL